jgi:cytochrome c oxidase subunit IV
MNTAITPAKTYVQIWLALMALLLLTWGLAQLDLHQYNVLAGLTIALAKMLLVILFFMQVRLSSRVTWIFVAAGFIWFAIMVDLTLSDYLTRASVPGTYQDSWRHPALTSGETINKTPPNETGAH